MNDGQPNTTKAYTESDALARDIKEGNLSGFVGNGTTLTGEANFKGMLRVDGTLSGRVSSQDGTLIVSTGGQVDANVEVSVAQIYGTVNGDVTASKRIELGRVAKVTGNIQTPALVIEQGAIFEEVAAWRSSASAGQGRGQRTVDRGLRRDPPRRPRRDDRRQRRRVKPAPQASRHGLDRFGVWSGDHGRRGGRRDRHARAQETSSRQLARRAKSSGRRAARK